MKDLGNSDKWDFEPIEIENCEHALSDEPVANSHAKHRVSCDICGYEYTYLCHIDKKDF